MNSWVATFRVTTLPATDTRHEEDVRHRIRAVRVDGETPDVRTAAVTRTAIAASTAAVTVAVVLPAVT